MNSSLAPNAVKTLLDKILFQDYESGKKPGLGTCMTPALFNQVPVTQGAQVEEQFAGSGYWDEKGENVNVPAGLSKLGHQKTFTVSEWGKSEDVSKNLFDDEKWNLIKNIIRSQALEGRETQNKNAFAIYRGAFDTIVTGNAAYLCADSQALLNSSLTNDNKLTAKLTEETLNDAIIALAEQYSHSGVLLGFNPNALLVAAAGFKRACEIVESELKSQVANNDMNVYSDKFGITVHQSPHLGTKGGGSDDYWFLLSELHNINRYKRQDLQTSIIDWTQNRNNNYVYKATFREVYGASSHHGIVGSTGTTGAYA